MEPDKAFNPVHVGFFRAQTVVLYAQSLYNLLKQFVGMWNVRISLHRRCVSRFYYLQNRGAKITLMIDNNQVLFVRNHLATCPAKKFSCFLVATLRWGRDLAAIASIFSYSRPT